MERTTISALEYRWETVLQDVLATSWCRALFQRIHDEYSWAEGTIFPPENELFRAFQLTPPDQVKVVILGQDPYHGQGQANGLAFSVNEGVKLPPSLKNIFKELSDDIGCEAPTSGDLSHWAEQGVLLLNSVLSVEEGKPKSHDKMGWQSLTTSVLSATKSFPQPIVFILWGSSAQSVAAEAEVANCPYPRLLIESVHPSPLSAYRGFFGSKPFSKANNWLVSHGCEPIMWQK